MPRSLTSTERATGGPPTTDFRIITTDRALKILILSAAIFWGVALCPGFFITDSCMLFGRAELDGYDGTFSYSYQLAVKVLHSIGLPIALIVLTFFIAQLALYYGLLFYIGRYLLRDRPSKLIWAVLLIVLLNPIFPIMFSLHSPNTVANRLLVLFAFLNFRVINESLASRSVYAIALIGPLLTTLRADMWPTVLVSYAMMLVISFRRDAFSRSRYYFIALLACSVLVLNVALPRAVGYRPSFSTYVLSLIYRPLDKLLGSTPKLLEDPNVTDPIEAIIQRPASTIVGHGNEVYWWDIDRHPSPDKVEKQLAVLASLSIKHLHVIVGDRASLLIELLGSSRSFFINDLITWLRYAPLEETIERWKVRDLQFAFGRRFKERLLSLLPAPPYADQQVTWSPQLPTYWLWNQLPFFLLLVGASLLYPFIPATSFACALIVLRTLVLCAAASFGFYFYATSVYLGGLLLAGPLALVEHRRIRRT